MSFKFNIFSADAMDDPHPLFSEIRRCSPVCQVEPDGWWAVSRYQDVVFVLKHPELFSSADLRSARLAIVDPRLREDPLFPDDSSLISSDPPVHTRLRKLISGAFARRRCSGSRGACGRSRPISSIGFCARAAST